MPMTKEDKEIAVGMWEMIRDDWIKNPASSRSLVDYKHHYLSRIGYDGKWQNNCLLCEYYSYYDDGTEFPFSPCTQCPLGTCNETCAPYYRVWNKELLLQDRINACNEIIKCIEELECEDEV